jgi:hypothetical protein
MAGQWNPGLDDYYVKQWGAAAENAEAGGRAWGSLVNNVYSNIGGCQYELGAGDEALWAYNAFVSRPILALFAADPHYAGGDRPLTARATLGTPFTVEALSYEDFAEDKPPEHPERTGAAPFAGAVVAPVTTGANGFETVDLGSTEAVTTNAEGKATLTFTTPGWHRLKAGAPIDSETGEEEAIRSNRIDVCVPAAGETGCGEPPAEDRVRTPPRYTHPGEPKVPETPPASTNSAPGGEQPKGQTLPAIVSHPPVKLTVVSLGARRLVVTISQPGTLTVKLARRVRVDGHIRWRAAKTIKATATTAGRLTIALGHLRGGTYRASIAAATVKPVVRAFVVRGGR